MHDVHSSGTLAIDIFRHCQPLSLATVVFTPLHLNQVMHTVLTFPDIHHSYTYECQFTPTARELGVAANATAALVPPSFLHVLC